MEEIENLSRYYKIMFGYVFSLCGNKELTEDIVQDTFVQAILHEKSFRGDCKVETWLCQIAKNALTKELRRQRRAVPFEETHELAAPDDIFELLADKEQAMRIHASLHRLKEPYREVFTLRVLGELHFRDIADLFGKSESWAKVTFYRAKDKLIEDMEEHHEH